jgi:hypothetical protein
VEFEGLPTADGYYTPYPQEAAWLYGLVAVDAEGRATYSPAEDAAKGRVQYTAAAGSRPAHLWLVVMAAPTAYHRYQEPAWDDPDPQPLPSAQWPYQIRIR